MSESKVLDGAELDHMLLTPGASLSAIPGEERRIAISRILAAEANRDDHVHDFRVQALNERLLPLREVDTWIRQQAERDGPSTYWLSGVALKADDIRELKNGWVSIPELHIHPARDVELSEQPSISRRFVVYLRDSRLHSMQMQPVTVGGILDRLRRHADILHEEYLWDRAQAATFLLTSWVPYAWLYESELVALRGRKPREMGRKSLELAVFTAERSKKETLAARMSMWNSLHPEWAYTATTNFGWQSQDAIKRLVGAKEERAQLRGSLAGWQQDIERLSARDVTDRAHVEIQAARDAIRGGEGRRRQGHTA